MKLYTFLNHNNYKYNIHINVVNIMVVDMRCPYCGYEWKPRVKYPKKCPMCQRWLPPWKEVKVVRGDDE